MDYLSTLSKIFHYKHIDRSMVSQLYALSQKSLVAIIIFSLIMSYVLYPSLSSAIVVWEGLIILLAVFRIYLATIEKHDPSKFEMLTWYKIFVSLAFGTATLFALLGSFGLFYLDEVQQIFVVATLIGMTAGAMSSLFPDVRIVVGYISIILIPLIVSLLFIKGDMHAILAFLVAVYFVTQIIIILNTYKQNRELDKRKEEVYQEQLNLLKK